MNKLSVRILCSANASTGMGHLVRSSALAVALRQCGCTCLLQGDFSLQAQQLLAHFQLPYQQTQADLLTQLQQLPSNTACVIDSYALDDTHLPYMQRVVLIDDFMRLSHYPVLGVLNFTLGSEAYDYRRLGAASQALGVSYFLPQASIAYQPKTVAAQVAHLLLLIGSGDPTQLIPELLAALTHMDIPLTIRVLTASVSEVIQQYGQHQVHYLPMQWDMNGQYQWADFCITSGGLAKYECAYLAMPSAVFSLTALELQETQTFARAGLCFDFGLASQFDAVTFIQRLTPLISQDDQRRQLAQRCQQQFNAQSATRAARYVVDCFLSATPKLSHA